jgi:protoporphyrinogen oxidase
MMRVTILGGGLTGVSLGYFLTNHGVAVEIFEGSPTLGGLAGSMQLEDGAIVDRYYHAILPSDDAIHELCHDLNLTAALRFNRTENAFFVNGVMSTMNSATEFMRFPPLSPVERVRLALTVARAQFVRDWRRLDEISVHEWLRRWSGDGVFGKLWLPMLDAKFDGAHDGIPATWMWARLVRMKSTRSGANQRESAGHMVGGYATLLQAMADRIVAGGGRIHLNCPVQEIVIRGGRAVQATTARGTSDLEIVVSTLQTPLSRRLIPGAPREYQDALEAVPYLGVVCPLVVMDRPFSPYWVINIADRRVPFTGVIETTSYINPEYVGGHHLVYLPKYTAPGSSWLQMSDADIRQAALDTLKTVAPAFDERTIREVLIHRERYAEPLHHTGGIDPILGPLTPIKNLFLATTAQIYPSLPNGESVVRHARSVADLILRTVSSWGEDPVHESSVSVAV